MFWDDPYKQQLVKRIESLMAAGNFQKAADICGEVLDKDPDDSTFLKLLNRIELAVQKENEKKIDELIDSLEPLWEEKKYTEIIQELQTAKQHSPNYPPLLKDIAKAQALYREGIEANENEQMKKTKEEFETLFKENKLDEIVQRCQSIETSSFKNEALTKYVQQVKQRLIDLQLQNKKEFLQGDKYDEILNFLNGLSNIMPNYNKLKNLIEEIKLRKVHNLSAEQEETSFKAVDNVKTLLKLGKYEDAYHAAQELAVYNPESKTIKKLLEEAESKFDSQLRDQTVENIEQSKDKLRTEYEADKDGFTHL